MPPFASSAHPSDLRPWPARAEALVRFVLSFSLTRFLAVGTAGLFADATTFFATVHFGASEPVARAVSLAAATALTWRLNRRFTFGPSERLQGFEGGWYTGVALGAQGLNYAVFLMLRAGVPELPALGALFCGAVCAAAFSYSGQRFVTFRGRVRA